MTDCPPNMVNDELRAEIKRLKNKCEFMQACLSAPEIYVGVITEACERHWAELIKAERTENQRLKTELATARETNRSLNRRCQLAERAVSEKVTAATGSVGRGLANYAASMCARELTEAREESGRLRTELDALVAALTTPDDQQPTGETTAGGATGYGDREDPLVGPEGG